MIMLEGKLWRILTSSSKFLARLRRECVVKFEPFPTKPTPACPCLARSMRCVAFAIFGVAVAVLENVLNDLGYAALEQGKVKEAIPLFQGNVAANPNSANAYDGLADGHLKDG